MPTEDPPSKEANELFKGYPIIRYSLLNKFLPLRIGKRKSYAPSSSLSFIQKEKQQIMYLTESDPECYCDEYCSRYNDCCTDYQKFCERYLGIGYHF